MDERKWIHAIQRGNKKYLQDIAEKYYDDVYCFCAYQTGSREAAYDLAQETFLRFIRYVEGYRYKNLKGYLLTIARNLCKNWYREQSREMALVSRGFRGAIRLPGKADGTEEGEDSCGKESNCGGESNCEGESNCGRMSSSGSWEGGWTKGLENLVDAGQDGNSPEEQLWRKEASALLTEALEALPTQQKEAILLHYFYDLKYREIARITGTNTATVKSRVKQGTDKLRKRLRREDFFDA